MNKILFFGKPGAGKGTTINKLVSTRENWVVLSTGNALREAVKSGTEIGQKAKSYMDKGDLVPDDVIVGVVKDALKELQESNAEGVILDGFPRTLSQAESMVDMGIIPDITFVLDVSDEEVITRLANRVECESCRAPYSLIKEEFKPKNPGTCDKCGGKLVHRADDDAEVVKNRLTAYAEQTEPVLNFLEEKKFAVYGISSDISAEDLWQIIL